MFLDRSLGGVLRDRRAISALEYALMAGLLATVVAAGMTQLGGGVTAALQVVADQFTTANGDK